MSRTHLLLSLPLLALACGSSAPPSPTTPPAADCAKQLLDEHGIDVSPEPKICVPLRDAIAPLGPTTRATLKNLAIVRATRGPCGAECPDLASAVMSDATLASYKINGHQLRIYDATFDGPRWLGGTPTSAAVREYLDALGLADWAALVARVRTIPNVTLPADVPEGSPLVFEAIVRHGATLLLGGEIALVDLVRHELGHAVMLEGGLNAAGISSWSTISGFTELSGEVADGFIGGVFESEKPIVASRLVLGLPRGEGRYRASGTHPTKYASFDSVEDYAEAFRLVHADPAALGKASPARLIAVAAGQIDLRAPALRAFVRPGVAALLGAPVDPMFAMEALRVHGEALLPEAADLADPRPLVIPPDTHPTVKELVVTLSVRIGAHQFRPSDAAVAATLKKWEQDRRDLEEFQRGLPRP